MKSRYSSDTYLTAHNQPNRLDYPIDLAFTASDAKGYLMAVDTSDSFSVLFLFFHGNCLLCLSVDKKLKIHCAIVTVDETKSAIFLFLQQGILTWLNQDDRMNRTQPWLQQTLTIEHDRSWNRQTLWNQKT